MMLIVVVLALIWMGIFVYFIKHLKDQDAINRAKNKSKLSPETIKKMHEALSGLYQNPK